MDGPGTHPTRRTVLAAGTGLAAAGLPGDRRRGARPGLAAAATGPAALSAGADLVMVSWAIYSHLDAAHPAGLASTVVQGELRGRLGFTGVTVTDAIAAGALSALGTIGQNAVAAAAAGMDLVLEASGSVANGQAVVSALATALQNGSLDATAFGAARGRVNALRSRLF